MQRQFPVSKILFNFIRCIQHNTFYFGRGHQIHTCTWLHKDQQIIKCRNLMCNFVHTQIQYCCLLTRKVKLPSYCIHIEMRRLTDKKIMNRVMDTSTDSKNTEQKLLSSCNRNSLNFAFCNIHSHLNHIWLPNNMIYEITFRSFKNIHKEHSSWIFMWDSKRYQVSTYECLHYHLLCQSVLSSQILSAAVSYLISTFNTHSIIIISFTIITHYNLTYQYHY